MHEVKYQYNLGSMIQRKFLGVADMMKELDFAQADKLEVMYNYKRM